MKSRIWVGAVLAGCSAAWAVTPEMQEGLAHFQADEFEQAQVQFQAVAPEEPDHASALYHDVLCARELGAYGDMRAKIESIDEAELKALPLEQQVELKRLYPEACFRSRQFTLAKEEAEAFLEANPTDSAASLMREISLVSAYHIGRKDLEDVQILDPQADSQKVQMRLMRGLQELERFKAGFAPAEAEGFANVKLQAPEKVEEYYWRARVLMGENDELRAEAEDWDPARRERMDVIRLQARFLYSRDAWEEVYLEMKEFLETYPESTEAMVIKLKAAEIAIHYASQKFEQSEAAFGKGDQELGQQLRQRGYFYSGQFRTMAFNGLLDPENGLHPDDRADIGEDVLKTYTLEKNYHQLLEEAPGIIALQEPGTRTWGSTKIFVALALWEESRDNIKEAIAVLDEVLAAGIEDNRSSSNVPITAAFWRAALALEQGDTATVDSLVAKMGEMADGEMKQAFLARFSAPAGEGSDD